MMMVGPGLDNALYWHCRNGHLGVERYLQLSVFFDDVPIFPRKLLRNMLGIAWATGKVQRGQIFMSM